MRKRINDAYKKTSRAHSAIRLAMDGLAEMSNANEQHEGNDQS